MESMDRITKQLQGRQILARVATEAIGTRSTNLNWRVATLCLAGLAVLGCQTAYYSIWEKLGREKRDLLRSNVETVQKEQRDAADNFESALDRLRKLYAVDAGQLEKEYDRLKDDNDQARASAAEIHGRIEKIETIARDLFAEWGDELNEISNPDLRARSRKKRTETMKQYKRLSTSLKKAEAGMQPVLTKLNDHVLYLKHNLNAAAVGGLGAEIDRIGADIDELIDDMNESIAEADRFLKGLPD